MLFLDQYQKVMEIRIIIKTEYAWILIQEYLVQL